MLLNPGIICPGNYHAMPMAPMGLLRIGAYLQDKGYNVKFIDGALPPNNYLTKYSMKHVYPNAPFVEHRPCGSQGQHAKDGIWKSVRYYGKPIDLIRQEMVAAFDEPAQIWVGSHLTYYYETSWQMVHLAKDLFPCAKVLLGGIYPTLCPEHASRSGADVVVKGELEDLEGYMPDYSLLPYHAVFRMFNSSRGCPVNPPCGFCSVSAFAPKFKAMDVDLSMKWLTEEFNKGIRHFNMWSSQLLMPPRTFLDFANRMKVSGMVEKGIRMDASEGIQPSLFDDNMAKAMRGAGFNSINIPLEAIKEDRIEEYHKPSDMNDVERSIHLAKKHGFSNIVAFVMASTPKQELPEVTDAIAYCWKRHVRPSIMAFTPVPQSEMFDASPEFNNRPIEELNPYLWPATHDKLTSIDMEDIISVAEMGFDRWMTKGRADTNVDAVLYESCKTNGLMESRKYYYQQCQ